MAAAAASRTPSSSSSRRSSISPFPALRAGSVGILHCLDGEESLQELFMGCELAPQEAQQQHAAPSPLVDLRRIVVDRTAADSLDVVLMSAAAQPALTQ